MATATATATNSLGSYAAAVGEGSLSSVLSTENRDFLISPSGDKVYVKEIEDNTIGLYFGANWYSPCENFTPVLASVYHQLRDKGSKFEVVFVSSDEDQASFDRFYSKMPWQAIPFSDLQSKRSLTQRFQIEGIPSLIILDSSRRLVRSDGVELVYRYGWRAFPFTAERIAELEAEEKAKHASQTLENLLLVDGRDYVMSHEGQQVCITTSDKLCFPLLGSDTKLNKARELQVPVSSLVGKTVGLYFSADWCPPCAKFTSRLISIYNNLREKNEEFEIVFVSMDRDEAGYSRCYTGMPWLSLPYDAEFSKALSRYFDVQGIPTLVIIGPDGKTVTREGRNLINLHLEMAFPFTDDQVRMLQVKMDEEAKSFPALFNHVGHRHVLKLVSENSGGGPYICCECEEQGLRWAYQCLGCGYEVHLKCVRQVEGDAAAKGQVPAHDSFCAIDSSRGV
ncbi:putative nucleoredoxin 2 isoform X1 [Iris pallida]|uniref:protein-disulfide reductase n=1 Tax=Iris pallida TaxID=29817 RepID=A0AAX6IIZ0_IRIPA|nr:putative nucleoredoxin 2 isoform X1 [Iris pallida]